MFCDSPFSFVQGQALSLCFQEGVLQSTLSLFFLLLAILSLLSLRAQFQASSVSSAHELQRPVDGNYMRLSESEPGDDEEFVKSPGPGLRDNPQFIARCQRLLPHAMFVHEGRLSYLVAGASSAGMLLLTAICLIIEGTRPAYLILSYTSTLVVWLLILVVVVQCYRFHVSCFNWTVVGFFMLNWCLIVVKLYGYLSRGSFSRTSDDGGGGVDVVPGWPWMKYLFCIMVFLSSLLMLVAGKVAILRHQCRLYEAFVESSILTHISSEQGKKSNAVARLLQIASVDTSWLVFGICGSLLSSGSDIVFNAVFGTVIDEVYKGSTVGLDASILALFGTAIGMFLGTVIQTAFVESAGTRLVTRIQRFAFWCLMEQDAEYYDSTTSGKLVTMLSTNSEMIRSGLTSQMATAVKGLVSFVGVLIYLCVRNWQLTLIFLGSGLIPLAAFAAQTTLIATLTKKLTNAQQDQGSCATENISSFRTVLSFAMQHSAKAQYATKAYTTNSVGITINLVSAGFTGLGMGSFYAVLALALLIGGHWAIEGKLEPGFLVSFINLAINMIAGLAGLVFGLPSIAQAVGASADIFAVIDRVPAIHYHRPKVLEPTVVVDGSLEAKQDFKSELHANESMPLITFKDVTFAYPTRSEKPALTNFDLKIYKGQKCALVGPSGSGKSTVLALLDRFYDPQSGCIILEGRDLREWDPTVLRRSYVGFVMQEPVLFSGTIASNIRYGAAHATQAEVEQAAREANAHDFIIAQPEGYDTVVGEKGASLSGGQKQRVAIARAILKNPTVLILDEATSALDSESEMLVQEALNKLMKGRTTVVVAHRLSTIRDADTINVFEAGRVVQSGSHSQLMTLGGPYAQLVTRQNEPHDDKVETLGDTTPRPTNGGS